ncbi:MAG: ABC transporter ATP-binding protein [Chlamydiia bacterium]|nr:ABC transporter ATP-binding protein [Chlamydiia bacterium]
MLKVEKICTKAVLKEVSASFAQGEIHALIGRNGAGKTTLLKTIKRLWLPSSGEVFWNDIPLSTLSLSALASLLAFVPQNPPLFFHFSVQEFVEMGAYPGRKNCTALLEELSLAHLAKKSILEISGGERKRAYIARSLLSDAPVLLLDEPLSSLDPGHQWTIWKILEKLSRSGKTVIVTLHDFEAALRHSDTTTLLSQGQVIASGKTSSVITSETLKEIFALPEEAFNDSLYALGSAACDGADQNARPQTRANFDCY